MVKTRSPCQHTALKGKFFWKDMSSSSPLKECPLPSHEKKKPCPPLGRLPSTFIYGEYALYLPLTQSQSGKNFKIRVYNILGDKNSIALVELS